MAASLQDRFLPAFDVREHHVVVVPGPPERNTSVP
jgi:hypothetical protein